MQVKVWSTVIENQAELLRGLRSFHNLQLRQTAGHHLTWIVPVFLNFWKKLRKKYTYKYITKYKYNTYVQNTNTKYIIGHQLSWASCWIGSRPLFYITTIFLVRTKLQITSRRASSKLQLQHFKMICEKYTTALSLNSALQCTVGWWCCS